MRGRRNTFSRKPSRPYGPPTLDPPFPLPPGDWRAIPGPPPPFTRLVVHWSTQRAYYVGTCVTTNPIHRWTLIAYDDYEDRWHDLVTTKPSKVSYWRCLYVNNRLHFEPHVISAENVQKCTRSLRPPNHLPMSWLEKPYKKVPQVQRKRRASAPPENGTKRIRTEPSPETHRDCVYPGASQSFARTEQRAHPTRFSTRLHRRSVDTLQTVSYKGSLPIELDHKKEGLRHLADTEDDSPPIKPHIAPTGTVHIMPFHTTAKETTYPPPSQRGALELPAAVEKLGSLDQNVLKGYGNVHEGHETEIARPDGKDPNADFYNDTENADILDRSNCHGSERENVECLHKTERSRRATTRTRRTPSIVHAPELAHTPKTKEKYSMLGGKTGRFNLTKKVVTMKALPEENSSLQNHFLTVDGNLELEQFPEDSKDFIEEGKQVEDDEQGKKIADDDEDDEIQLFHCGHEEDAHYLQNSHADRKAVERYTGRNVSRNRRGGVEYGPSGRERKCDEENHLEKLQNEQKYSMPYLHREDRVRDDIAKQDGSEIDGYRRRYESRSDEPLGMVVNDFARSGVCTEGEEEKFPTAEPRARVMRPNTAVESAREEEQETATRFALLPTQGDDSNQRRQHGQRTPPRVENDGGEVRARDSNILRGSTVAFACCGERVRKDGIQIRTDDRPYKKNINQRVHLNNASRPQSVPLAISPEIPRERCRTVENTADNNSGVASLARERGPRHRVLGAKGLPPLNPETRGISASLTPNQTPSSSIVEVDLTQLSRAQHEQTGVRSEHGVGCFGAKSQGRRFVVRPLITGLSHRSCSSGSHAICKSHIARPWVLGNGLPDINSLISVFWPYFNCEYQGVVCGTDSVHCWTYVNYDGGSILMHNLNLEEWYVSYEANRSS